MSVLLNKFVQEEARLSDEYAEVDRIGDLLHKHLCNPEVYAKIKSANNPGQSSHFVQNVFLDYANELGFRSEKKGLFDNYPTSGLRPDYFLKVKNSGILLEV